MERSKYPRTPHLPWSKGATADDKTLENVKHFHKKKIVVTEKMDGENTTLYPDGYIHARSIDGKYHPSRDWIKADWASKIFRGIGEQQVSIAKKNWRVCGENLFAKHSIEYSELESYFYVFSIIDDKGIVLHWDMVKKFAKTFGYPHPKVLYQGEFDQNVLKKIANNLPTSIEGYVIRTEEQFSDQDFGMNVAKYVRENHVQTDQHWMHAQIVKNKLKEVGDL